MQKLPHCSGPDTFRAALAHLKPLPKTTKNLYVIGVGKAASSMARAV